MELKTHNTLSLDGWEGAVVECPHQNLGLQSSALEEYKLQTWAIRQDDNNFEQKQKAQNVTQQPLIYSIFLFTMKWQSFSNSESKQYII